jgi:hypothetical protein
MAALKILMPAECSYESNAASQQLPVSAAVLLDDLTFAALKLTIWGRTEMCC